jgi:hypothetical protein
MAQLSQYNYKKPRRINVVSILMLLLLAGGVYAGVKFVPVYFQAFKVDSVLNDMKSQGLDLLRVTDPSVRQDSEDKIIGAAVEKIRDLGIIDHEDQPLEVWFSDNYTYFNAKYRVVVSHPFDKHTTMTFHRKEKLPTEKGF